MVRGWGDTVGWDPGRVTGNRGGEDGVSSAVQPLPPLTADAVARHLPHRPATAPAPREREIVLLAGLSEEARVRAWREPGEGGELHLAVDSTPVGVHHFPPPVPVVPHMAGTHRRAVDGDPGTVTGHLPGHLARAARPAPLPAELAALTPGGGHSLSGDPRGATVLRADGVRQAAAEDPSAAERGTAGTPVVFADTSYPWSATGRVDVPGGWGSGVLVGPRHLLTAAHIIPWVRDDSGVATAGWVRFVPGAFDASEPFGSASAVAVYCLQPTYPPSIDAVEERVDFAVCVLDHPIGRLTGWMGVQAYRDEWDHLPSWSHVGYRGGHATGTRPSHQAGLALDGRDDQADTHQTMLHRGDVHPGQSGGPFFGWWAGEDCPRVVAVQSWGHPGRAGASGGDYLVDLVVRARQEHL